MKIKIRNTLRQRSAGEGMPGANERYRVSPGHLHSSSVFTQQQLLPNPLLPPGRCAGESLARSDCLSLSCHVKMVLRKCIFCIPSANEQHRYKTTAAPPRPQWPVVSILFRVFFALLDFYLLCSLAIFMPLLCLLFAFVAALPRCRCLLAANAFKTLRLFSL